MKKQPKKTSEPEKKKHLKDVEEEIVVDQDPSADEAGKEILGMSKKAEEYLDGWKRTQAEFENYRKMQSESQKDLIRYSTQNVIMQLIPVLDNFHMSTDHIPEDQKSGAWVVGIMHIQKQLEQVLSESGVEEIMVKVGDTFDPTLHEAIEEKGGCCGDCDCDKKYENKIKKVIMKGYKIGERVVRPARVVVE